MKYFRIDIVSTGKSYDKNDTYRIFNEESKQFDTLEECREYLKQRYGTCKRTKMFVEKKDGTSKQIGYVYGFHNDDISHYPVEKWLQKDCVTINAVEESEVLV